MCLSACARGAVDPADLDIESAKAKYDAQRAISDRAYARFDDYKQVFADIQSRYLSAVARMNTADSEVTRLRGEVDRIESALRSAEDEIPRQQSALTRLRDERSRLATQLDGLRRDEEREQRNLRQAQQSLQRAQHDLNEERGKPKPDAAKVKELERKVNVAQGQVNDVENKLRRVRDDVRNFETQVRSKDDQIASVDRKLEELRTQISQLNRDRDNARDKLADARTNLDRIRDEVSNLSGQVDSARTELALRESEYRRENSLTQSLYADYQAVLANYNRERDRILRAAADAAGVDGYREGIERGNPDGTTAGKQQALETAAAVGAEQGKARDRARGYRDGREKAKTDATLAGAYGPGVESGKAIATRKAEGEAFPKGYAAELDAHFAVPPALEAKIDVANAPADPGSSAPMLSVAKPPVKPVAAPTYPLPEVPGAVVPAAPQPAVSAPAADNRYYSEPCNDVPRPEFGQLCKDRYAEVYADAAARGYVAGYVERFKDAFGQTIGPAHAQAFAVEQAEQFAAGRTDGARDQGVLDGFAEALPGALVAEEAAGREAWRKLQASGVLVRGVGAALVDDDGLFAGGETLALSLVLDNYGGQATAKDGLVVKTSKLEGLVAATTDPVKLPSLGGNTRATLTNVLGLTVKALPAGAKVRFEGTVETVTGMVVASVAAEGRVAYPIEIESLTVPKGTKLGQKADVTVKLRNRRAVATKEAELKMSAENGAVTFDEAPVKVPSIASGESVEVVVPMTPTYWAGGNVATPFQASISEGDSRFTQAYPAVFPVARNGSLYLYDGFGNAVTSGKLKARANGYVNVVVKLNNETTAFAPGPFGIKSIKTSDAGLAIPSNNTISVQYGSLSPGSSWGTQTFVYYVPASLKGKTGWVQIGAYEGSNWLHVLQIELEVQ